MTIVKEVTTKGRGKKVYVKPQVEVVELRVEERLSACYPNGSSAETSNCNASSYSGSST